MKLRGIGAKTPNRFSLALGDLVVIYVGAPEYKTRDYWRYEMER